MSYLQQLKKWNFSHYLVIGVLVVPLLGPLSVSAAQIVIQDVKLQKQNDSVRIDVDFGVPLLYVKHFPRKTGEILQVQLQLSEDSDRRIHKEVRQAGDIKTPRGLGGLLVYVTYEEGVPGGPYLTLRFSHAVNFEVQAGSSLQTFSILVTELSKVATQTDNTAQKEKSKTRKSRRRKQQSRKNKEDQIDEMMAKARQILTFGDSTGAIELLRKIIRIKENTQTQDARELLGLALERSNQIPRAKFEYKKYLGLYRKGDGPVRVRQRLNALQSLGTKPREKLRRTRRSLQNEEFTLFGRWSQSISSYFVQSVPEDDSIADPGNFVASRNAASYLNIRGRYRGKTRNTQTVVAANHSYDLIRRDKSDSRISYMYVDYDEFKHGVTAVIGRQRARNTGIFGRFDGIIAGYRVSKTIKPSVFFGEPVTFFGKDLYEKKFWGGKLDLGETKAPVNGNLYFIHQTVDQMHDRQAFGSVLKYTKKGMSLFGQVDYDIVFKELNTTSVRWGWQAYKKLKFNVSYIRRSDLLTSKAVTIVNGTVNSYDNSTVPPTQNPDSNGDPEKESKRKDFTIAEYKRLGLTEDEIHQIAIAKSIETENSTIGMTYQLDKDRQVNFDVSIFSSTGSEEVPQDIVKKIEDAQAAEVVNGPPGDAYLSLGPEAVPVTQGTGDQFLYSLQWISSNTFVERDLHMVGLRYADYTTYSETSVFINSRLPPVRNWNPRPRLEIRYRTFTSTSDTRTGGTMFSIKPSLKVDYRWKKAWVFDAEIGVEYQNFSQDDKRPTTYNEAIRFSYHYTF